MVQLSFAFLALAAVSVQATPVLQKRIAQTIADSTAKWEQACLSAGGGQQCNPASVAAFGTLLAAAGPCDQQNAADALVDLSKQLKSDQMIALSQLFAQQPRNTPTSQAVPYCQQAPKNAELNGLFQCQFAGANQQTFVGGLALGTTGTIPFGHTTPLSPLGSCLANPGGPIADGQQLSDITTNPNAPDGSGSSASAPATASGSTVGSSVPPATSSAPASTSSTTPASAQVSAAAPTASGFRLANGQAAQKLNAQFATLTANSSCTAGQDACVGTAFAQCVGGKFVTQSCGASLICAALPLVNSAGTSITCTTTADALARIAATGATGGLTGSGGTAASASSVAAPAPSPALSAAVTTQAPPPAASAAGSFRLQNGKDAQALNKQFAALTADSPCTAGQDACVNGGFAQCVSSKFVVTPCSATLTCAALPLVNKAGTSIACTTQADALTRIQATGATGGISG